MGGLVLIAQLFLAWIASAQSLNPKFNFVASNPALEGRPGVVRVYRSAQAEAHLKTLPIGEEAVALRALEVNFGLIKGLYEPKKNPYAGEVTSLIECDRKFKPIEFKVKCPSKVMAKAIAGGASERHAFGVCTQKDIRELAAYFSCYDSSSKSVLEVRLFLPYVSQKAWSAQLKNIERMATELLQ